jgi:hypothetical protein
LIWGVGEMACFDPLPTFRDRINLPRSWLRIVGATLRIRTLIAALSVSSCASAELQPSAGTIARIETGLAGLEDLQTVGVGDIEGMRRAARTRVRNVRCSQPQADQTMCTYESARRGQGEDWTARRRTFTRRGPPAPGTPHANGWVAEESPGEPSEGAPPEDRPTLNDLGLWDPPWAPKIRTTHIPPPSPPETETLFAQLAPGEWATALSAAGYKTVSPKHVRSITCVGLQTTYMLCGWEQRVGARWRRLSQYADVSRTAGGLMLIDRPITEP